MGTGVVGAMVLQLGCIHAITEESSAVGALERDCVVPPPAEIRALGAPVSLEYPGGSLWIWETLAHADGGSAIGAPSAFVARGSDDAICATGPVLRRDMTGAPVSLMALDAAEVAANAIRTDGRRVTLAPTGGFVVEDVGYLFYDHALDGPGVLDRQSLGAGLCVLAAGAERCDRVRNADGGSILWPPGTRVLDRGGLVEGDRAIVFGCRRVASFSNPCVASSTTVVPPERLRDPAAWSVFNAFDGWVDRLEDASALVDEPGALTVSAYDGGYLATSLDIFESRFYVRRGEHATGEFGPRSATFKAVPPGAAAFLSGGREHASLRVAAHTIHVTYHTDGSAAPGLHLARFRFFGRFQ